jgi:ribosomal-protein-alanine N-acetyltransferase
MITTTLTTERLLLRPPRLEDAVAMFQRYTCDPEVTHFLTWSAHESVAQTIEFLEGKWSLNAVPPKCRWVICVDGDEAPCGMISAARNDHAFELGYALSREQWGRGVMTEATKLVTSALLLDPTVWRVVAHTHIDNVGSQRVLEKAGFRREGLIRRALKIARTGDTPQDGYLYACVRDDLEE